MRVSSGWKDYELVDCSSGERLERWGDVVLIRPDPQAIWQTPKSHPLWGKAHARYKRSSSGGGRWEIYNSFPKEWKVSYKDLSFKIKPMGFKHTGLFPEQAVNWDFARETIKKSGRDLKVLNLFAYTGGATVACLASNASVVHVDASKGMVLHAKENAAQSHVENGNVRYIVDDCVKFVQREIKRGNKYDIVIMDPPSYGRGPGGEVWKLEERIYQFVELCAKVLSDDPVMFLVNSYTAGLSPAVMQYILGTVLPGKYKGQVISDEIGLEVTSSGLLLPCGASAVWVK
ncbi:MAG: class I SAM-dependent methyltransferase [Oscillospiraceae bacterium]|jgi:23S rRNA (cytosine1962-C5)-methyltransferase|nr:class I SAM-dependent methyltransferase [Oscillospiraceae bacterium]